MDSNILVLENLGKARTTMLNFVRRCKVKLPRTDIDELLAEANLVLVQASHKYDKTKSAASFGSYLYVSLQHAFIRWCNRRAIITFPAHIIANTKQRLSKDAGLMRLLWRAIHYVGLSKNLPAKEDNGLVDKVGGIIVTLKQRDRSLIEKYYGLDGNKRVTTQALAVEQKCCPCTIRKRIRKAIARMRNYVYA